jgi:hypothetical protein
MSPQLKSFFLIVTSIVYASTFTIVLITVPLLDRASQQKRVKANGGSLRKTESVTYLFDGHGDVGTALADALVESVHRLAGERAPDWPDAAQGALGCLGRELEVPLGQPAELVARRDFDVPEIHAKHLFLCGHQTYQKSKIQN